MFGDADKPGPVPEDMAETVRRMIHLRGLKQATVAREAELSPAQLSSFLAGKYAGDAKAIAGKLSAWLENLKKRDRLPDALIAVPKYIEMPSSRRIIAALEYGQLAGDAVLVLANPGIGKTITLAHYAATRPSAWLATMTKATKRPVPMLKEIGEALDLRQLSGGAAEMCRAIVRRVRNTGGILLLDEAHHLDADAIEIARAIHDASGIGIALAGELSLSEKIDGFPQLASRIGSRVQLVAAHPEDIAALAGGFEIAGEEEMAFLQKIGRFGGALRNVAKTLRLACVYADGDGHGRPPALKHIMAAWQNLNGGIAP